MRAALVIGWGAGVPGRETKGLEVFGTAVEQAGTRVNDFQVEICRGGSDDCVEEEMGVDTAAMNELGYLSSVQSWLAGRQKPCVAVDDRCDAPSEA